MDGVVLCKQGQNPIVQYVHRRIARNQNFLGVVYGPTGSGKSFLAMRLAEKLDPDFNIDRLVFTVQDLMNVLDGGLKSGSVIIFDEAGTGLSARDWYSAQNKFMNYILQTFRQDNIILLLTVPDITFIDSNVRKLLHATIKTNNINYSMKICNFKFYLLDHRTDVPGKPSVSFRRFLRVCFGEGNTQRVTNFGFGMPQRVKVREYEDKKREWRKQLHKDTQAFIGNTEGSGRNYIPLEKKILQIKREKPGLTFQKIAAELDIPYWKVLYHKKKLEATGEEFIRTKGKRKNKSKGLCLSLIKDGQKFVKIS